VPLFAALPIPATPTRRINDYAGVLSAEDRDRLERKLLAAEQQSGNQVVVALFRSLEGESLEDYSIRLARAWRAGQKGLDNGVVVLAFIDDRKMRLEVGYGLEANLTDATAGSIIRDVVAPRFREGRLADGLDAGLDAIGKAIAGTYQAPAARATRGFDPGPLGPLLMAGLIIVGFALIAVNNARRRHRRGWTGGRDGWVIGSPDFGGSWGGGGGPSWGGGGSSPSGSDGGFSPGGGDFGGGGASGDW
jgi:uncharacterized protein